MIRILALLWALFALSPAFAACTPAGGTAEGIAALNQYRAGQGAKAVSNAASLTAQAQKFACDMVARGYFSHTTPEGQKFGSRLKAAGFSGGCGAENIAYSGGGGVGQALAQWKASAPHKRNMLGRKYAVAGLAGATGGGRTVWVLILGKCS
ncbi:MAG: CAP domain-containing protein [Deltaproteobacteria bacterium]